MKRNNKDLDDHDLLTSSRSKKKKPSESLEPFGFFITASPSSIAPHYPKVMEWLEGAINRDFLVSERPLAIEIDESDENKEQWIVLLEALATPALLEQNWVKSTIVNKIICLYPEESWKQDNLVFAAFQRDVWWIKNSHKWFDMFQCNTPEEYLKTGFSALVLELFYRFVQLRHTLNVYHELCQPNGINGVEHGEMPFGPACLASAENRHFEVNTNCNNNTNSGKIQCGISEITVGGMLFVATGEEENETSTSGESIGSDSTLDPEALDETADKTDYNVDDDEIVVLCDDLGAASSDEDTSSSDSESEDLDESLLDSKERFSNGASRDDVAEAHEGADGQAPEVESLSLSIEEESDGEDYPDHGLPAVVSLFFKHPVITEVIDEIESSALAEEGKAVCAWDIARAIEVFARLVEQRNTSLKLSKKPSRAVILSTIHELYSQQFIPFLRSLGILCSTEPSSNSENNNTNNNATQSFIWRWDETLVNYVDLIYIDAFRNLTENGTIAHSRTFLQLFPNLFMHADSGASSSIFNVTSKLQNILESKGKFNTGVDSVVVMIDQLSDEKKNLLRLESEFEEEKKGQANASDMNAQTLIGQQLSDCRKKRLQEIEALLNSLEEVFFKLTGAIDHIEPKKKLPKQKKPKKEKKKKEKKPKKETVKKPSAPKKDKPAKATGEAKPKKPPKAKSDAANGPMEIEGTEKKSRKKPVKKQPAANGEVANGVENGPAKPKPARKKAGKADANESKPIETIPCNDLNSLVNTNDVIDRSFVSPVVPKAAFDDEIDMDVEITEKLRNIDIKDTL